MTDKTNQRSLNSCSNQPKSQGGYFGASQRQQSQVVQYSLNDILLTVGYMQLNEYLLPEATLDEKNASKKAGGGMLNKFRSFFLNYTFDEKSNFICKMYYAIDYYLNFFHFHANK